MIRTVALLLSTLGLAACKSTGHAQALSADDGAGIPNGDPCEDPEGNGFQLASCTSLGDPCTLSVPGGNLDGFWVAQCNIIPADCLIKGFRAGRDQSCWIKPKN